MVDPHEDPVVGSARREAPVVALIFLAAMIWTVGYCYLFGYNRDPATVKFILGFPDWVMFGVVAPWAACVLASLWFGRVFMRDAELGPSVDQTDDLWEGGDA
jgi:hypothetical protein